MRRPASVEVARLAHGGDDHRDFLKELKPGTRLTQVKKVGTFTADHDGDKGGKRFLYKGVVSSR
jgi:hypothetical protein